MIIAHSERLYLTWQETTGLLPEDEGEGGSEIYYYTDEDGTIRSREFLDHELVPDESEAEDSQSIKST